MRYMQYHTNVPPQYWSTNSDSLVGGLGDSVHCSNSLGLPKARPAGRLQLTLGSRLGVVTDMTW